MSISNFLIVISSISGVGFIVTAINSVMLIVRGNPVPEEHFTTYAITASLVIISSIILFWQPLKFITDITEDKDEESPVLFTVITICSIAILASLYEMHETWQEGEAIIQYDIGTLFAAFLLGAYAFSLWITENNNKKRLLALSINEEKIPSNEDIDIDTDKEKDEYFH